MSRYQTPGYKPEADPNYNPNPRNNTPSGSPRGITPGPNPTSPGKIKPGSTRYDQQPNNGERMNPKAKPNTGRGFGPRLKPVGNIPGNSPKNATPIRRLNPRAKPNTSRSTQPVGNIAKMPEYNRQVPEETDPNKKAALRRLQKRRNQR